MRTLFSIIWLSSLALSLAQSGELVGNGISLDNWAIEFEAVSPNKFSVMDISGEITETDEIENFTINGVPVSIHNLKFKHRIYLKPVRQPLEIRISDGFTNDSFIFKTDYTTDQKLSVASTKNEIKAAIEEDPYNIRFHRAYVKKMQDDGMASIMAIYDDWIDNDAKSNDMPNVCLIYSVGYAAQEIEKLELANLKYRETLWLEPYFAPAHLGLAKYYHHEYEKSSGRGQDKKVLWDKVLEHYRLAHLYNYNDVFYIEKDINKLYHEILISEAAQKKELYADAYLSRAISHPAKVVYDRIMDVTEYQGLDSLSEVVGLNHAYLDILEPKGMEIYEDELTGRVKIIMKQNDDRTEFKKLEKNLKDSREKGRIFSILGSYYQEKEEADVDLAAVCYRYSMASYYRDSVLSRNSTTNGDNGPDYKRSYYEAIIQLHKERDETRGKALFEKAKDVDGDDVERVCLLREALFCNVQDKEAIRKELKDIYNKYSGSE